MNTWQLAEDFRAAFEGVLSESDLRMLHGQGDESFEGPCAVFSLTEEVFSQDGRAARFTLSVTVDSPSTAVGVDGNPDGEHAARVKAVQGLVLGAGKAELLEALRGLGRWNLRGWSAAGEDPGQAGRRFSTPVRIVGTVIEKEPVVSPPLADSSLATADSTRVTCDAGDDFFSADQIGFSADSDDLSADAA